MIISPWRTKSKKSHKDAEAKVSTKSKSQVVKDAATFKAAADEIADIIAKEGCINIEECSKIVLDKAKTSALIQRHFPGAMSSAEVLSKVKPVVEHRGYTADNTLFAQSICPDEINHEEGDIPNLFAEYLGEVFHLGGLAGIPFSGKTGFGAFSHHVPDEGHCFILMAPHVGCSDSLKLGHYSRDGQSCDGAACGAAVGALRCCTSGKPLPKLDEADDYQMAYIIQEINKRKESILDRGEENAIQAELAKQTYGIAKNLLDRVVSTNFGCEKSTLVVLSGIQINMPRAFDDFFQPLCFEIHKKDGQVIDTDAKR